MSINKQLYFGIYGICSLFGLINLILLLLSALKLFFTYKDNIQVIYNEIDDNIVSLNAENADIFSQLLFHQANFETYFFRNYYNILSNDENKIGENLMNSIYFSNDEIKPPFVFSYNNNENEKCENCFFVFKKVAENPLSDKLKKILFIFRPTIEISLNTYAFSREDLVIFNKFSLYDKDSNAYVSYKYNQEDIKLNFNNTYPPSKIVEFILIFIKRRISIIGPLNEVNVNELTYKEFFDNNIFTLYIPRGNPIVIDPYFNNDQQTIKFGSLNFNKPTNHEEKINNYALINSTNIDNYINFDIKLDYLSYLSINFMKTNGNFIFIVFNDFSFSASKSICKLNDFNNYIYSDDSINGNFNLDFNFLKITESQAITINECISNSDIQKIIKSDSEYKYKSKHLYDWFQYSYNKDINNEIKMKILRELSPNKYTTSFLNLKFYYSFSYYLLVFKIYNNISIFLDIIYRITYRQVSYIMLFIFILWVVIFIYIFIQLYFITDRISSPIRKLIKNISLSQSNYNIDEIKLEQIYYQEDKDINDLFQLCQNLIIGGFQKKVNIQKKNKLNVYNNISKVKTNNMAINENQIIIQRNQKYNEIFEKGEDKQNINDTFQQDLYYKYKSKDFDNIIKNYESKRLKRLLLDKKEEIEKLKNKNNEYKMFYYTNKELEGFIPYNNLYKFYYERFSKKANKKKKK